MKTENIICPECASIAVRYGPRKLKYGVAQRYRCKKCGRIFSDRKLKHKTYLPKVVLNAISTYNLGYTLEQTNRMINRRFKLRVPESTLHSWVKYYRKICAFSRLRGQAVKLFPPEEAILSENLDHRQIYKFQLHKAKLKLLEKELPVQKFPLLVEYLMRIPTKKFPHHIFQPLEEKRESQESGEGNPGKAETKENEKNKLRASQIRMELNKFVRVEKQNHANILAGLALKTARTNKERHQVVQNFMLINDSVTIATEVPVYLTHNDIQYFIGKGFNLDLSSHPTPITGHIDVLQIRNGLIHILDYKPEAKKINPVEQLTTYALALGSRTKLAVRDFKCAWFDKKNYYEFFPLHAVYRKK